MLASRYGLKQRKQVLAMLWRRIYADERVAPWEDVFVRHVTRALGLSDVQAEKVRAATKR